MQYENYNGTSALFLTEAAKIIYQNRTEIDGYIINGQKLQAVKTLKEYSGGGLKESKDAIDLYIAGKLNFLKEDRRLKLERLAKNALVETLTTKLKNLQQEELKELLLALSVNELLSIDEFFSPIKTDIDIDKLDIKL